MMRLLFLAACSSLITQTAFAAERSVSFRNEILPLLAKQGCSAASCHGAPSGKGELQLSLWGLDVQEDYKNLAEEDPGVRVNKDEPVKSLLLAKPSRAMEHKGGLRLPNGSRAYKLMQTWIEAGCPDDADSPPCQKIELSLASELKLNVDDSPPTLKVTAIFQGGKKTDVTHLAVMSTSNNDIATISADGVITTWSRGLTAVNVRFQQHLEVIYLTVTDVTPGFKWKSPPPANKIDELVYEQLKVLETLPTEVSSDEEFFRRIHLDVVGVLPSVERVRDFLSDESNDKRLKLIDELLKRPEHAKFWAQRWGDLLRITKQEMGKDSALKYAGWIEESWAENAPYDEFARKLITSDGDTAKNPIANFYRMGSDHFETMESAAAVFMGTRIQCAKCHNHPYEKWTQYDYHGLRHFFSRMTVESKGDAARVELGPSMPTTFPGTKKVVPAWLPARGSVALSPKDDPRDVFADWLTAKDNPYFARVEANRIWAFLFGRGIVEPYDDFRETNPPSNPRLLDALEEMLVESEFDRRHVLRTILTSNTYQASARSINENVATEQHEGQLEIGLDSGVELFLKKHCIDCHSVDNAEGGIRLDQLTADFASEDTATRWKNIFHQVSSGTMPPPDQDRPATKEVSHLTSWITSGIRASTKQNQDNAFFAHYVPHRLSAEQLLDAISHVTGTPDRFRDVDRDTRATQLPVPDLEMHEFLKTFGQPQRSSTCSCNRPADSNLSEALAMYNGRLLQDKLKNGSSRFRTALKEKRSDEQIVEELFLAAFCRLPTDLETEAARKYVATKDRRDLAFEDLCWAIITTSEFLTQH